MSAGTIPRVELAGVVALSVLASVAAVRAVGRVDLLEALR